MDVGTNGETVLGNREWLVTCACSAGPAFEGAGVLHGMRATEGAIEEVWINGDTFEPTWRVIGGGAPRGLCGSGLIALLAEMFITGVVDRSGNINLTLPTPRIRRGEHGPEYVVAWGSQSDDGHDIVITRVDIDNLLRAKAAIYAGFTVLAEKMGLPLESAEQVLIGGSFGKYINVEKAVEIGLLPDMPWDRFRFLGNTSVRGAYLALLDRAARARITGHRGPHDLYRTVRRQHVLRRVHVGAVFAAYRHDEVPVGAGGDDQKVRTADMRRLRDFADDAAVEWASSTSSAQSTQSVYSA